MSAVLQAPQPRMRPMRECDLGTVVAMERDSYDFPWSAGIFRDCLRVGYSCWVLEMEALIDGYGIMSVAAGESHILNLCVAPVARRRGYGRMLLEGLLVLASERRADTALLEVRPSNRAALALYAQLGFVEVGMRRAYYPAHKGREDALILARSLIDRQGAHLVANRDR
jgi:[ribosomal protein S18]-alanine N-acetyltransferase